MEKNFENWMSLFDQSVGFFEEGMNKPSDWQHWITGGVSLIGNLWTEISNLFPSKKYQAVLETKKRNFEIMVEKVKKAHEDHTQGSHAGTHTVGDKK